MSEALAPLVLPESEGRANYDSLDPLDGRYFNPEATKYLSDRSRIACQAYVEGALAHTLADFGLCSREIAQEIEAATHEVTAEEVYEEEARTRHDIKALVNCIKAKISDEAKPWVHFGATSFDIISTASALQMRLAMKEFVVPQVKSLMGVLIGHTATYAETAQIGRTHGQHGVPITFGFAMAEYVSRLGESSTHLEDLTGHLQGKFSGAVGAANALNIFIDDPQEFERKLLARLDLEPAPYSTQIVPPDNTIRLLNELGVTAGIMANLGNDMRHLQRTEINEVRERFEAGQTGSSTMAHKRNPISFENIVGLHREVVGQQVNAMLNISSEHQRDLADSASSRFYPTIPALIASMAARLTKVMDKIEVDEEALQRNLKMTEGAIAAEPFYLLLEKHGHTAAHEKSKAIAHTARQQGISLAEAIQQDKEARQYWDTFTKQEKAIITNPELHYTGIAAQKAHQIADRWRDYIQAA